MLAAWQRLPAVYTRPSLSFSRSSSSLSPWVHYTPILLYSYTPILLYSYTPPNQSIRHCCFALFCDVSIPWGRHILSGLRQRSHSERERFASMKVDLF